MSGVAAARGGSPEHRARSGVFVLAICLFLHGAGTARAESTGLHTAAHFFGSFAGTWIGTMALERVGLDRTPALLLSSAAVLAAGLVKEFAIDERAEGGDLAADAGGIALAGIVLTIRF